MSPAPLHTAIIGAGITGLSAAFYLQRDLQARGLAQSIAVIEAESHIGGKIRTIHRDGFTLEQGPDSFLASKTSAIELVRAIGLEGRLVHSQAGRSYVLQGRHLRPIPSGAYMGIPRKLWPLLGTRLISPRDKVRVVRDWFRHQPPLQADQSLGQYFRQRLGDSVVANLIEPLLSGIYGGDIDQYSLEATLPQYYQAAHGSSGANSPSCVARTANSPQRTSAAANAGPFMTLQGGLESLTAGIAAHVAPHTIRTGVALETIQRIGPYYRLVLHDGRTLDARNVILTAPAHAAASLLPAARKAFLPLLQTPATSVAVVTLAFPGEAARFDRRGTGFLVPHAAGYSITACTWTHLKWPHTTPDNAVLLRCYVGSAGVGQMAVASDEMIVAAALRDLQQILALRGAPIFSQVQRWVQAMPQYTVGHVARIATIRRQVAADYPGIILAGAPYGGVGLPDCIQQGKSAAHQAADELEQCAA